MKVMLKDKKCGKCDKWKPIKQFATFKADTGHNVYYSPFICKECKNK